MNKDRLSILRYLIASILLPLFISVTAGAQDFDEALELYESGQYEKAATLFEQLDEPEATLFTGKSYYSLGQYLRAKSYLNKIPDGAPSNITLEARYTSALSDYHLGEFGNALNSLYTIKQIRPQTQLVNNANSLYEGILDYLTVAQRRKAYYAAQYTQVKTDLIKSSFNKVEFKTAKILLDEYRKTVPMRDDSSAYEELADMISDSLSYTYQRTFGNPLKAPRGTIYNIGAALPKFKNSEPEFSVTQGLYYGYVLATEEFNQRNTNKKAFIRFQNTGADMDSAGFAMTDLAWNYNVDVLLGPLYSEPALRVAKIAEEYQIPLLAPLANSDSLNLDNPYVYQANPTFTSHGKRMAEYAVKNLKMDTLAVLAEKNSLGAASAHAFRNEAERLGAHIAYYFVKDLEARGYEISDYTKHFDPSDTLNQHIDGIYAPFTSQAAPTLIDLLLIDLEAMNSDLTVLGSQTWGDTDIPGQRLQKRSIYFTESFYINQKNERLDQFKEDYSNRFGTDPNRYAMIGYDSASFLLSVLERVENPALLKDALKRQPMYEGLISNIHFGGTHVNQEVKLFKISDQGIQPATD